jgi:protein-L-isoaspartate(D-aspartate) O-methyltransferase
MNQDPRASHLVRELRAQGIEDARVLAAMQTIPREVFVENPFQHSAYENTALPIACGQTISQPYVVALATEALEVGPKMRVLEVGTGSGYQAAILSPLARMVYTLERHRPLLRQAEARFRDLRLDNIVTRHGDGLKGWPEQAPFDRILCSAALPGEPESLIEQLKPGGILVAPVTQTRKEGLTESISQLLTKMIRTGTGVERQALIPVMYVPMVAGLPQETRSTDGSDRR